MVHISSGVSALVCALYLTETQRLSEAADAAAQPGVEFHRSLLIVGGLVWIQCRQRAGVQRSGVERIRGDAFRGGVGGVGVERGGVVKNGRASALGAISGAVAGLVAITPASGFVAPMPALVIGLVAGSVCYWMVTNVKACSGTTMRWTRSACMARAGTIGALLTGVFAQQAINPIFGAGKTGGRT